jgi:hypothetical protein
MGCWRGCLSGPPCIITLSCLPGFEFNTVLYPHLVLPPTAQALIVLPLSLLGNWQKELKKWAPEVEVRCFHGSNKAKRNENARYIRRYGGIVLTTYGLVTSAHAALNGERGKFVWDYIILDEGKTLCPSTREKPATLPIFDSVICDNVFFCDTDAQMPCAHSSKVTKSRTTPSPFRSDVAMFKRPAVSS